MRIVPVIDLKNGVVVRGVAGHRDLYQPVESVLGCAPNARSVAEAFRDRFGFRSIYVADLDAIAGLAPNWAAYDHIMREGHCVLIDAGISSSQSASEFLTRATDNRLDFNHVVGLESLSKVCELNELCNVIGPDRVTFSLDLKAGKPLTEVSKWCDASPLDVVEEVTSAGFAKLIVLDLASVGVGQGLSVLELCHSVRNMYPHLDITSGGGVRDKSDLYRLEDAGCDAALVASALHNGSLTAEDVAEFS